VRPTWSKPLRERPRPVDARAGRHPRFPDLLQPSRLFSQGRLLRLLRLPRHYGESRAAIPGLRRPSLPGVGTATKARTRRLPSMRATMIRTLRLRFLTRMRSKRTSVSRALRMSCPHDPRLRKLLLLLPFPLHHLRGQVHLLSRANLPRRPGNRWICPEWRRHLPRRPRKRLDTKRITIPTTIPPPPKLLQQYRLTRCHRPLRTRGSRTKCLLRRHRTVRPRGLLRLLRPLVGHRHGSHSTFSAPGLAADPWTLRGPRWNRVSLLMTST
jgi:hypothetical protein